MAVAIIMPRQGQSVESCIITKWNKQVGDKVEIGDLLFSYETDKASFDEEAKEAGTLLAILAEEGDDVPVLENVAVIGSEGEDISAFTSSDNAAAAAEEAAPVEQKAQEVAKEAPAATGSAVIGDRLKISPRARNAAQNQNLDAGKAVPTGPDGRIIERDIVELSKRGDAAISAPAQAVAELGGGAGEFDTAYEDVKLTGVRRAIAKSMLTSLQTMAQLTHNVSFDAADILNYRKMLKANGEALGLGKITLNDIILYAVSRVLKDHNDLNAHYLDDKMRLFKNVNLGMAVDTPRGLLVPTIYKADTKSLSEISAEAKELAAKAQEGSISPDYLTNGTFTVSNLGSYGTESFTPVINPPQTGILGVNNIQVKLRMEGDKAVPYQAMGLSLTYDHRAVDGAPVARFLVDLCKALENFTALLAK